MDYQRFVFYEELFHKLVATEAALHNMEDPQKIAIGVMKAACDLYDADWSGILIADLHSQMWRPEIWYEVATGPMQDTLFHEFEMTDEYVTWVTHLMDQEPLVIPDVEAIKESCPKEYEAYQRLDTRAVIGVPFGQHPLGFMVVRNPKKNIEQYEPLQIACFVVMMMLEQKRRLEAEHKFLISEGESGVRAGSIELLIEFAEYFHVSLDFLILGRVSRTDEAKEELTAIKERMNYIMQLL